jgi:small subunit ribosomal protein S1
MRTSEMEQVRMTDERADDRTVSNPAEDSPSRLVQKMVQRRMSKSAPRSGEEVPTSTPNAESVSSEPAAESGPTRQSSGQMPRITGRALRRMLDEDLGDELAEALAQFERADVFAAQTTAAPITRQSAGGSESQKRTVRVLAVRGADVFVDLGEKSEGVLAGGQFGDVLPKAGDLVEVIIDRYDPADDVYVVRRPGTAQEADWGSLKNGMLVNAKVEKVNKGGLEVRISGIRGFLPAGQAALKHIADLSVLVGQVLLCEVTELNVAERNLIVSRRSVLERERAERAKETLATLEEGQVRDGVVKRLTDFGAFVDIGGVDGLLHIREMSWTKVHHPGDLLSLGQQVRVVVLRFERETGKISLGLKQLSESPWQRAAETYRSGSTVSGTITRTTEFGAFVELEPGIEGLIHISELAHQRVRRVTDVVQPGRCVDVKILDFDAARQRISLSLKQVVNETEEAESDSLSAETESPTASGKKSTTPLRGGLGNRPEGPLFGSLP